MSIHVDCPGCGKGFSVDPKHAGKQAKCPGCRSDLTIPLTDKQIKTKGAPKKSTSFLPLLLAAIVGIACGFAGGSVLSQRLASSEVRELTDANERTLKKLDFAENEVAEIKSVLKDFESTNDDGKIVSISGEPIEATKPLNTENTLDVSAGEIIDALKTIYAVEVKRISLVSIQAALGNGVVVGLVGPKSNLTKVTIVAKFTDANLTDLARTVGHVRALLEFDDNWVEDWLVPAFTKVDSGFTIIGIHKQFKIEVGGVAFKDTPILLLSITRNL